MTFKKNFSTLVLVSALSSLALVACGGDDPTIISRPSNGGSGAEPSGNAGNGGSDTGAGGTSAAGTSAGGTSGEAACVESPATADEFLRRCTDSACRPFDNVARLSLYRAGVPLPEVP
jgi:hypothetical protein